MNQDQALLVALRAAAPRGAPLPADHVRRLGAELALSEADLVAALDRLAKPGLVRLSFDGMVTAPEPKTAGGGIHIGGNVTTNGSVAIGDHATAGNNAIGAGATVQHTKSSGLMELVKKGFGLFWGWLRRILSGWLS